MAGNIDKTGKEKEARKGMPQNLPNKKFNLRDWQRYVRKETQRLVRDTDTPTESEIVKKPPLPEGPHRRTKKEAEITRSIEPKKPIEIRKPVEVRKAAEITMEDLDRFEQTTELEQDLDMLLEDSGVELDDTLKDWVEPEITERAITKIKPAVKEKKSPHRESSNHVHGKIHTLELFGEELEKARRKPRNPRKTREHLIENLLDPVITLDEAAVILNVCKTTVRRYTNGGKLECLRTPGNQRRFRLSQVLEFLEEKEGHKTSQLTDNNRA